MLLTKPFQIPYCYSICMAYLFPIIFLSPYLNLKCVSYRKRVFGSWVSSHSGATIPAFLLDCLFNLHFNKMFFLFLLSGYTLVYHFILLYWFFFVFVFVFVFLFFLSFFCYCLGRSSGRWRFPG